MVNLRSYNKVKISITSGVILTKDDNIYQVVWDDMYEFKLVNLDTGSTYRVKEKKTFTFEELEKVLEKEGFIYVSKTLNEYIAILVGEMNNGKR